MTLAPGEGAILSNPSSAFTRSFVGEVPQGYLENSVPSGYSIRASKYPKAGLIGSLCFPVANGDTVRRMVNGAYSSFDYHNGIWAPEQPVIGVGESFWIVRRTGWKQNILLWP
jgi:hypothetical protein